MIVWGQSETGNGLWVQASKLLDTGEPVTAVDTLPLNIQDKRLVHSCHKIYMLHYLWFVLVVDIMAREKVIDDKR